jgi:hypothetical protein
VWIALGAAALAALGLVWPAIRESDYSHVYRTNLVLAVATMAIVLAHHRGLRWLRARRDETAALGVVAALSLAVYADFLRVRVHYHEVAHYYLGSKYFDELGYWGLYTAMLRADAEQHGALQVTDARDLTGSRLLVPSHVLLLRSQPVKDAFTPDRWLAFKEDFTLLYDRLGPHYAGVLRDHGFNASPLWALIGGAVTNLVPSGSLWGIRALVLLDLPLLLGTLVAVARCFGLRAAFLSVIHFAVLFGATFGWTGGAVLRHMWFSASLLALCAFQRARPALAGSLLAFSAMLRVFPAFFMAGVVLGSIQDVRLRRRWSGPHRAALAGFLLAATGLFVVTGLLPRGYESWVDFADNLSRHTQAVLANLVGLTRALCTPAELGWGLMATASVRPAVRAVQLVTVLPAVAVAVALVARRRDLVGASALGVPLIFASVDLTSYYYSFLVFLTLAERERPWRLAALFGLEAASYALFLFTESSATPFLYRSVLVLCLLVGLYSGPVREELRRRAAPADARGQPMTAAGTS